MRQQRIWTLCLSQRSLLFRVQLLQIPVLTSVLNETKRLYYGALSHVISCHPYDPSDTSAKTSTSENSSNNGCSKCRTVRKSSKRSCCVRGGAWFKNCGDAGDRNFDHTWAEGFQACKGRLDRPSFAKSFIMNAMLSMLMILLPILTAM